MHYTKSYLIIGVTGLLLLILSKNVHPEKIWPLLGGKNTEAEPKMDIVSENTIINSDTTKYDTIEDDNYCTVERLQTPYINNQGITITDLPLKNNDNIKYDSLGLQVEFQKPYTISIKYQEFQKKIFLYDYWSDTTDNGPNWSFLRMSKVETSKRVYFYIEMMSPWERHWEYLDEILIDITQPKVEIYTLPENLYGNANFGDFDCDSYLDYVEINDSLKRIQMYSLKKGRVCLNKSKYLSLAEVSIPSYWPVYKVIDEKKGLDSWAR